MKLLTLFSLALMAATSSLAFAGQEGHGGDPNTLDFRLAGRVIALALKHQGVNLNSALGAYVYGPDHLCVSGSKAETSCPDAKSEVPAFVDLAQPAIYLNLSKWNAEGSLAKRLKLAYNSYMLLATHGGTDGGEIPPNAMAMIQQNPLIQELIADDGGAK